MFISASMPFNLCQMPIEMKPIISNQVPLSMVPILTMTRMSLMRHRTASKPILIDSPSLY